MHNGRLLRVCFVAKHTITEGGRLFYLPKRLAVPPGGLRRPQVLLLAVEPGSASDPPAYCICASANGWVGSCDGLGGSVRVPVPRVSWGDGQHQDQYGHVLAIAPSIRAEGATQGSFADRPPDYLAAVVSAFGRELVEFCGGHVIAPLVQPVVIPFSTAEFGSSRQRPADP